MALGNFYHLEDEFGFTAMLKRDTVINAALTPMVKCRILKFHQKYMDVQLVEVLGADKSEFSLSEKEFYDIIGEENWNTQEFRNLMLGDTPSDIFDLECHRWIAGLSDSLNQDELQILLRQIHSRCLETLESEICCHDARKPSAFCSNSASRMSSSCSPTIYKPLKS